MVLVQHAAIEHVGDGFEAAMRVIRKPANIVGRLVGCELVKHQKRVKIQVGRVRVNPQQFDPSAIVGGAPRQYLLDLANIGW
jgi:hypothetical protein